MIPSMIFFDETFQQLFLSKKLFIECSCQNATVYNGALDFWNGKDRFE